MNRVPAGAVLLASVALAMIGGGVALGLATLDDAQARQTPAFPSEAELDRRLITEVRYSDADSPEGNLGAISEARILELASAACAQYDTGRDWPEIRLWGDQGAQLEAEQEIAFAAARNECRAYAATDALMMIYGR